MVTARHTQTHKYNVLAGKAAPTFDAYVIPTGNVVGGCRDGLMQVSAVET